MKRGRDRPIKKEPNCLFSYAITKYVNERVNLDRVNTRGYFPDSQAY